MLIEVAAWREREAQSRDVPRGRVLKDDVLGDIATQAPTTPEKLAALRSLPRGFERSKWGQDILEAVKRGLARDPAGLPPLDRPRAKRQRHGHGRAPQGAAAHDLGAPRRRRQGDRDRRRPRADRRRRPTPTSPALHGWRRELFGDQAIALKHGQLALAVEKGKVVVVERG